MKISERANIIKKYSSPGRVAAEVEKVKKDVSEGGGGGLDESQVEQIVADEIQPVIDSIQAVSDDLATETDARETADGDLATAISDEETRALAAEGAIQSNLDQVESELNDKIDSILYNKESKVLAEADLSFIDLEQIVTENSLLLTRGRDVLHESSDYVLSSVGDQTRVTWAGDLLEGEAEELQIGDLINAMYRYLNTFTDPLGIIDTSFGDEGFGRVDGFQINHIRKQPSGKLVVCGDLAGDLVAARFNKDGSFDTTFGDAGLRVVDASGTPDGIRAACLDNQGRVIMVGTHGGTGFGARSSFVRLTVDGDLDTTFNSTGIYVYNPSAAARINEVFVQPDGKIVGLGEGYTSNFRVRAVRLNDDGTLDNTFGTSGSAVIEGFTAACYAGALGPDGSIYASGASGGNTFLMKILPDGSGLDTSFDTDGFQSYVYTGGGSTGYNIEIKDGNVYVCGSISGGAYILKVDQDSIVDTGFGTDGWATASFGPSSTGEAFAFLPNGKMILIGTTILTAAGDYAIAKFLPNGQLDTEFGDDGIVTVDFDGQLDLSKEIVVYNDGSFVVGGNSNDSVGDPQVGIVKLI